MPIHLSLARRQPEIALSFAYRWKGLERILEGGSSRDEFSAPAPPRGLYMHGGVGTGKTMLMDLLVETAPPEFKVGCALVQLQHHAALLNLIGD